MLTPLPSKEILDRYMDYDPETGILRCREQWFCRIPPGSVLGHKHSKGYTYVCFRRRYYLLHRLAYRIMTGEDPGTFEVDHRDGNSQNNKWENLRFSDRSQNLRNGKLSTRNQSGVKGVSFDRWKGKWVARLCRRVDGKHTELWKKCFNSLEEGAEAIRVERVRLHQEFARHD